MRIETPEVKREDGSKFKIVINVYEYSYLRLMWSIADVMTKEPHKRTWIAHRYSIEDSLRSIDFEEKVKIIQQKLTDLVGEEEVKKAFQYAYDYIKPDILKENHSGKCN